MDASLRIVFDDHTYRYKAEFYTENNLTDWKYLTQIEEENLSEFLGRQEQMIPIAEIMLARDAGYWLSQEDGSETNFDAVLDEVLENLK